MRCWLCLVLAACGAESAPAPVPAPPVAPAVPALTPAPAPPPPLTAAHGAEIAVLATTADGLAVATADRLGGVRLWPVLDGTREPVVIQGTPPRALALVRDGDGFAIGMLDAAGVVRVVRTTAAGAVRDRVTVHGEAAATAIVATAERLLVLRADQTVELVAAGGPAGGPAGGAAGAAAGAAIELRLSPEPGTHITQLVARSGRVLALIADDRQLHGRWIVVDHGARWGADTPNLPFPIRNAVLSPSGALLAVTRPRSLHPALIDLAHGTASKQPLCVGRRWPHEDGDDSIDDRELLHSDSAPLPLGFLTDDLVACAVMTQLVWWSTDGTQRPSAMGSFPVAALPVAMTDAALVIGAGPSLGFAVPDAHRFLGYAVHEITGLRVTPSGALVGSSDHQLLLDPEPGHALRERARFELGHNRAEWLDVVPLDERHAIVALQRRLLDRRATAFQLAVFDGLTQAVRQVVPYTARDRELSYEPSTRLVATSDGQMALLLRYDPVAHVLGEPVRIASATSPGKLVVLDPRRSGGIVALDIAEAPDGLVVGELTEGDVRPGTTVQPATTYRVPGELRAVDRAGHLYTHRPFDRDDVVVYARDQPIARLPGVGELALRPSADGSRIAALGSPRLVLLSGDGEVRWDSAQWSGAEVGWTASGDLVVQFPTGVARVDLETGELAERRCGWDFGLADQLFETHHTGPSICDAVR
jgi:hypothetical protein